MAQVPAKLNVSSTWKPIPLKSVSILSREISAYQTEEKTQNQIVTGKPEERSRSKEKSTCCEI